MKLFNHTQCDVVSKQVMNSSYIVEASIKLCFALFQDMAMSTNINMYPDVDF